MDTRIEPSVAQVAGRQAVPPRPRRTRATLIKLAVGAAVLAFLIFSWIDVQASLSDLVNGLFGPKGLFRSIIFPNLPGDWSVLGLGLKASVTTFCVAALSIVFGALVSVAMLPFAARNITPSRFAYETARGIQAFLRSIPELIMMLLFLAVVGITPFSAVIALSLHGVGVQGKLYAEAVEELDMTPIDALRVAGASRQQVFLHAVLPGVRNTLTGLTLYRLDANFRSAVVLGALGAGGIGFNIDNSINDFEFKVVITYLVIMMIWIMVIERVSTMLRARFI
jgi:phosphonate transport system permease protein